MAAEAVTPSRHAGDHYREQERRKLDRRLIDDLRSKRVDSKIGQKAQPAQSIRPRGRD